MVSFGPFAVLAESSRPLPGLRTALLSLCLLLSACAATGPVPRVGDLAPLELDDRRVEVADVAGRVATPDLLALDDPMRDFVHRYTGDVARERARLVTLHRAIRGAATLGMRYDPEAEGTARDAFHRGTANCLSYASLFVALAREAGLDAHYQWLAVSPRWMRDGDRVTVRLHVNVLVKLGRGEQFMVDIDPLEPRDIAGSRQISDTDALALYLSNSAMSALARGRTEDAWLQSVRALELSPGMAHLWVNLGVVYRFNGQHAQAERSYRTALQLDAEEYSAMNNLAVLFEAQGRSEEQRHWERELARYRDANPYYHAWLGDEAAASGEWRQAVSNYERALALAPGDSRLLSALGRGYQHLGQPLVATGYVQRAIEAAPTYADNAAYRLQLESLRGAAGARD